jgi:hypothetical protein
VWHAVYASYLQNDMSVPVSMHASKGFFENACALHSASPSLAMHACPRASTHMNEHSAEILDSFCAAGVVRFGGENFVSLHLTC